jgi:beta-glucosidase
MCITLEQISADGKSPSIWDTFSSDPTHSEDGGNTSTATETYTKWQEDIALMKFYGVNSYRLSLSWARILPDGVAGSTINKAGVEWYRKVLRGLLDAGIVSGICESVTKRPLGTPWLIESLTHL